MSNIYSYKKVGFWTNEMQASFFPLVLIGGPINQWEAAEEAIHQIVTHSDDEFSLTYDDLKKMLDWKDRLEELSVKCSALVREVNLDVS